MEMEKAAKSLEEKFRDRPWFLMVGTGETDGRPSLFLYVKSIERVPPSLPREGWEGFQVVVQKIGVPRPALSVHSGRRRSKRA
jgi:hypothetical protein